MVSNKAVDPAAVVPQHDFADILVYPHLDLHLVRSADPALELRIELTYRLRTAPLQTEYILSSVVGNKDYEWNYQFFAPHNEPPTPAQPGQPAQDGHRFDNLPVIDQATGVVTAGTPGVYLFQIEVVSTADKSRLGSVVGRLQVHEQIVDWWFGNDSLTTAKDSRIAHSQISMYARFSDDKSGADLVHRVAHRRCGRRCRPCPAAGWTATCSTTTSRAAATPRTASTTRCPCTARNWTRSG
jgi:hypothetical protein